MPVRIDTGGPSERLSFSDDVRTGGGAAALAEAVGQIGDRLAHVGMTLKREREQELAAQQQQADRVFIARAAAEWRLRKARDLNEQLDGYDGAEAGFADRWIAGYQKAAEQALSGVPEHLHGVMATELIRQGEVLAGAAIEGESGRRRAWTLNGINAATDAEAEGILTAPDLFADAVAGLPQLVEAAPASVRAQLQTETATKYATAYAEALLTRDPGRLLGELEAGDLDAHLSPGNKANWLRSARGAVERQETEARQAAERAQRELDAASRDLTGRARAYYQAGLAPPQELLDAALDAAIQAGDAGGWESVELARYRFGKERRTETVARARSAVGDVEHALKLGLTPSAEMFEEAAQIVAASGSKEQAQDLADLIALSGKQRQFALMDPVEAERRRAELRATPATRETAQELALLEKVIAGRTKAIGNDDMASWLASNGVPLAPLSAADPDLANAIASRAVTMTAAAQQLKAPFQLFGKAEAEAFGQQLGQMTAPERLRVLGTVVAALGPNAGEALRAVSKTAPADAQAGLLLLSGRDQAARDVAAGLAALKQDGKLAPARGRPEIQTLEALAIGAALPPELATEREAIGEAARAIYAAARLRTGASSEDVDNKAYQAALNQAAGKSGERGGFGQVNGAQVLLPPQLTARETQALITSGEAFGSSWYRYSYGDPENGKSGGPPAWMDREGELRRFEPDALKKSRLVTRGMGLYWVKIGGEYVLDLDTGAPFVLDLRRAEPSRDATSRYSNPSYRGR